MKASVDVSHRRDFIPRPELCRKNRRGIVLGYGKVPAWNLTLREIEEFLSLPHEP
jgi:hypothetical protein